MLRRKTQRGNAGLQGEFKFLSAPSNLTTLTTQAVLRGYCVDRQLIVSPVWRRCHD